MIKATVRGLPDLRAALAGIVPKLRVRALRNALAAGARVVQREARGSTPVLKNSLKAPYRQPGTVRKAISVRTSRLAKAKGNVGVFVNVRPAKRGARGAKSKTDPFYWRWLNFGHRIVGRFKGKYTDYPLWGRGRKTGLAKRRRAPLGFVPGKHFMEAGAARLPQALEVFVREISKQIAKLNKPKAPAP